MLCRILCRVLGYIETDANVAMTLFLRVRFAFRFLIERLTLFDRTSPESNDAADVLGETIFSGCEADQAVASRDQRRSHGLP